MTEKPSAFPLEWPAGWPRTRYQDRERGSFSTRRIRGEKSYPTHTQITLAEARTRLGDELDRLGARYPILSTNVELRLDGLPRSGQKEPIDPGAAVYFHLNGKPIVLACDNYQTVGANLAAIAAHIGAMRGMARWRVGRTEQLFTGYVALPAATPAGKPWWQVLGFDGPVSGNAAITVVEGRYRRMIREAHPDAGGSHERAAELNAAIAEARKVLE
jgi:hypothetical protein